MPMGMTQTALAELIKVDIQRVNTLVNGKRDMTPETALLLARGLGTSPEFWMNLQTQFDLWHSARKMRHG